MDTLAKDLFSINVDIKQNREKMKPMNDQIIERMLSTNTKTIDVQDGKRLHLLEKKVKKTVGVKMLYSAIDKKFGADALKEIKMEVCKGLGEPKSKYSIKFVDAE
jgi:hypothetical protein